MIKFIERFLNLGPEFENGNLVQLKKTSKVNLREVDCYACYFDQPFQSWKVMWAPGTHILVTKTVKADDIGLYITSTYNNNEPAGIVMINETYVMLRHSFIEKVR